MVKSSPSNAGASGPTPGQGAQILYASQPKNQNVKQKQYCNKFNKDFKKWSTSKEKKKEEGKETEGKQGGREERRGWQGGEQEPSFEAFCVLGPLQTTWGN